MMIIAHRGASAFEPENTIISFKKAIEMGVDMVEIDVRQTQDKVLIVHHDSTINRTTNGMGRVDRKTYHELLEYNADNKEKIPSLYQVLELFKNKGKLVIEIKDHGIEFQVFKLVEKMGMIGDVFFVSFHHQISYNLKSIYKDLMTGIIYVGRPINPEHLALDAKADMMFIQKDYVDQKMIKDAHDKNILIFVWVVDQCQDFKYMKNLGVDGVISNNMLINCK